VAVLDPAVPEHAEAERWLRDELVVWLTTVRDDGQPQSVPVWFLWEDGEFLAYSQPGKPKLANIGSHPKVSLHLRGTETGGEVVTFEGEARRSDDPPADRVPAYIEKYRGQIDADDWTPRSFAEDYSVPIRITPTAVHVW
jgi:PPOX class probable F420-dependent enzyme